MSLQRGEERLSNARAQRNRLLAAFEGINAAEDDMEAVIARLIFTDSLSSMPSLSSNMYIPADDYYVHGTIPARIPSNYCLPAVYLC